MLALDGLERMNMMKSLNLRNLGLSFLMLGLLPVSAAEITGRVVLDGQPPEEKLIRMDALCGRLHTAPVFTRFYMLGKDSGLADTVVYIKEGLEKKSYELPEEKPLLDQVGCEYTPYVLAVMTNQKIVIKNSDPLMHNVHATPTVNKGFNFAQPLKDMKTEKSFDKPEQLVRLKCDVHPWMFSYVSVFDHPYFAVTDKDGNFKFSADLPAGTYTIEALHRKAGKMEQKITVKADEKKAVKFTLSVPE